MDFFQRLFIFKPALTFILAFMAITFIQSGLDKVVNRNTNLSWLKGHFSKTIVSAITTQVFLILTIVELLAGLLSVWAIINLARNQGTRMALCALETCALAFLMLLLGQRLAKEYTGASVIAIYFGICMLGIHIAT